jgi:hypothetical protein
LVPSAPAPGTAIPFLERHQHALALALEALQAGDPDRARHILRELRGASP